jgi:DNA-binding GntR family transcriptional regulator
MIDHDSATPVYVQLADIVRSQIQDGAITNRVPSIRTLSEEYGVSHVSAAKALDVLKAEELIVSVRGKGAFVRRPQT